MSVESLWAGVDNLIDGARSPHDLRAHGLHLLAVRRWRARGIAIPTSLIDAERNATFVALSAPLVLGEVRAAYEGAIMVLKGPEIAARYPDPVLRPYGDLDVLVEDAGAAYAAMLTAGFTPEGDPRPENFHHLRPLRSPRFPLRIEVHVRPSWLDGLPAPALAELVEAAAPTRVGADGILAPSPAQHAVLVAVHAWVHEPLSRISQLLDAILLLGETSRDEAAAVAEHWRVDRVWRATLEAADGLFLDRPVRVTLRPPLGRLRRVEERTVLESHTYRALAPFWAFPLPIALRTSCAVIARKLRPEPGERRRDKAARIWRALRHARMGRWNHERKIGFRR